MKPMTPELMDSWMRRDTWNLHECVCIALGFEPEGMRPLEPSAEYLAAERWIVRNVPCLKIDPSVVH